MHFIKKLIRVLIVLIGVSLLSFILANLSSVDPAEAIARRIYSNPTQEQIQDIRTEKGLDQPILTQYARWAGNCLHGDLGTSYQSNQPVIQEMAGKLTATLFLVGMALLWIVLITIPLGIVSAVRKDRFCDHLIRIITILGISIPAFWLGYLLLTAFAIRIPVFKVVDYGISCVFFRPDAPGHDPGKSEKRLCDLRTGQRTACRSDSLEACSKKCSAPYGHLVFPKHWDDDWR